MPRPSFIVWRILGDDRHAEDAGVTYWLIGHAPTRDTVNTPEAWLTPDSSGVPHDANRLLDLTGWTLRVFLATFTRRTTLWANPHRIWAAEGRQRAAQIIEHSRADGSDGVVILGAPAARMFDLLGEEPMEWHGRFAFVPHPSRQCRYWADPEHRARARAFFASLTEGRASRTT